MSRPGSLGLAGAAILLGAFACAQAPRTDTAVVPATVAEQILQHAALKPYLHVELPARRPLLLSDHLLAPGARPSVGFVAVEVVPDDRLAGRPHLRFEKAKGRGNVLGVAFRYDVEGIRGSCVSRRDAQGAWRVDNCRVWEVQAAR